MAGCPLLAQSRHHDLTELCPLSGVKQTSTEVVEKVLEKLATSEKTTIVISRDHDGKMCVTSCSWDSERVFLRDPGRDVRTAACRRYVACKPRQPDKGGSADHAPRQTKLSNCDRLHLGQRLQPVIDYILPAPAAA
jgi:hypothetical protein